MVILFTTGGTTPYCLRAPGEWDDRDDRQAFGGALQPLPDSAYRAHINVEVCSSLKVVKYLLQIHLQGTDRTTMQVDGNVDEIKTHPPESAWHIYCSHKEFS